MKKEMLLQVLDDFPYPTHFVLVQKEGKYGGDCECVCVYGEEENENERVRSVLVCGERETKNMRERREVQLK